MATKKGIATPKYKTGDRVIKKNSGQFTGEDSLRTRGKGAWKGIITEEAINKPDKRGATRFYYKVLRDGFKSTEIYVQQMLVREDEFTVSSTK